MRFSKIRSEGLIEVHGGVQFRIVVLILKQAYLKYQKPTVERHKSRLIELAMRG